jgi:hypothetical protein
VHSPPANAKIEKVSIMAKHTYSRWGLVAIGGGIALTSIEIVGATGYLLSQSQPHYLVAGGVVVTAIAAILPILAGRCWRDGRYLLAILLWLALAPALSVIVSAAVERTGSANDGAERGRQAVAQKLALAREAVADAKAVADTDEAAAKAECSSGRKTKCLGLEERADQSRRRLEAARGAVAQAGVVPKDPMASRIAAVLPINEEAIRIYQPLVLPLSISALGLLLITVGAHQPKPAKAVRRKGKRRRKSRLGPRKLAKKATTGTVVPFTAKKA